MRARLNIPADKMRNFTDFNRFVLIPALKEINSYASFAVKIEENRQGRKVTELNFIFTDKIQMATKTAKDIISERRPKLFIDNPKEELAYAYLLNATTEERRRFFTLAQQKSKTEKKKLLEEIFDRPDLWYSWIVNEISKRNP